MTQTAAEILATPLNKLFTGDERAVSKAFSQLAKKWHPDQCHDVEAAAVFEHLLAGRDKALGKTARPSRIMTRRDGTKFQMEYLREQTIEGMTIFTGASSIAYLVSDSFSDLLRKNKPHWKFATKEMEKEMVRFLPPFARQEELADGTLLVYRRKPSQILMSDLMTLNGERISPIQISWMVTRMGNIACYLEWAGLVHFALLPEFLLVDLDSHGVSLVGPSLYMTHRGSRPIAVPARTLSAIPSLRVDTVMADTTMDRQMIRATALALLGDPSGNRIKSDPLVRKEVAQWISTPPAKLATDDYAAWESALGPRKFVPYGKSAQDIYV